MARSTSSPLVTVLMSNYNGAHYLPVAIDSILNQRFKDFEFLIIDDGSEDQSRQLLTAYARQDSRIRFLPLKRNVGLATALNIGVQEARGQWIARMDGDDFAVPSRLGKQVRFMQANPQVGLLGSAVALFKSGENHPATFFVPPTTHDYIRAQLLLHASFMHPAIMVRRDALLQLEEATGDVYRPVPGEDYDLFIRLAERVPTANLRDVLLYYRMHAQQITATVKQQAQAKRIYQYEKLQVAFTEADVALHEAVLAYGQPVEPITSEQLAQVVDWNRRLLEANQQSGYFCPKALANTLWLRTANVAKATGNVSVRSHAMKQLALNANTVRFMATKLNLKLYQSYLTGLPEAVHHV